MLDDTVLAAFPPHTHPLTVVSDPDGVLTDEVLRAELAARGFRLVADEGDPIVLHHAVQKALPITAALPLVISTRGPLNALPYDLWQQGRHVTLDLAALFPGLDPAIVRPLSPSQRRRLDDVAHATSSATHPVRSRRETIVYILAHVFGFTGDGDLLTPAGVLTWLASYHAMDDPMPVTLIEEVRARLQRTPALQDWPLDELLADAAALQRYLQDGWEAYLDECAAIPPVARMKDSRGTYVTSPALPFANDQSLQDALPALVRSGYLRPEPVTNTASLPLWARVGVMQGDDEQRHEELIAHLEEIERRLNGNPATWDDWLAAAWMWASVDGPFHDPLVTFPEALVSRFHSAQELLDTTFLNWLTANYSSLAGRSLPRPHHLFHVPAWLAASLERTTGGRLALIVLDGMSLGDWLRVRAAWAARHPDWALTEDMALAEAPSITPISRLALIAGRRPNTFSAGELQNRHEARFWRDFWIARSLSPEAVVYGRLSDTAGFPNEVTSHRTTSVCLVSTAIDDMIHGATLGAAEVSASLDVWLAGMPSAPGIDRRGSPWLENVIERLLEEGFAVNITSDHGHVEAIGMGAPSEGVIAPTRSKRVRLYSSAELARSRQAVMPDTLLLGNDWLPPSGIFPLIATGRHAFAPNGDRVVTHGGLTIEEMIVPLITIKKRAA